MHLKMCLIPAPPHVCASVYVMCVCVYVCLAWLMNAVYVYMLTTVCVLYTCLCLTVCVYAGICGDTFFRVCARGSPRLTSSVSFYCSSPYYFILRHYLLLSLELTDGLD